MEIDSRQRAAEGRGPQRLGEKGEGIKKQTNKKTQNRRK